MNKRQFDALDDYFGALLEETAPALHSQPEPPAEPVAAFADPAEEQRRQALEALLARVAELKEEESASPVAETVIVEPEPAVVADVAEISEPTQILQMQAEPAESAWRNMDTESSFQVLFFEVAGMTFAVPLTHLGGIYQMSRMTSLFGKPDWFAGVLTERQRQLYVVDTARWAMPGHQAREEYQYLVTLGESNWGLGCHQLKGTALLHREQVKWRASPGSRPWLAGMVKEKMCALLHVDALIGLLEQGKNIDGQQA
ncbi:chemotaxis protein CheW [Zobellella iuensis]|uniref:Chemotaxis protein CheW n=1 Tax=Zobellella iuensis TaxID=2803811 RepID=A0ABS1QW63_9GAMM|nr:chemotaxis protein CheW [Zobellella iuensis]MBL1378363.1 chemotaxis protein CheW [Zobellella iuensis]